MNASYEHPSAGDGSIEHDPAPRLSDDDQRVLDVLIEAGLDEAALERVSAADRPRAQRLLQLFSLLDHYPVSDADDALVDATLARIDRYERDAESRLRLDPVPDAAPLGRVLRIRMQDLVTVAAVLLLGVSIGWPVLSRMRQVSYSTACSANLRSLGGALAAYANDSNGALPVMTAGLLGGSWDTVRNSDNLELLPQLGYCDLGHLDCPGHRGYGPSYSFTMVPPPGAPRGPSWLQQPTRVLLADRNPVLDHLRMGLPLDDYSIPSPNHGHRGQNVLFGSLVVEWRVSPVVRHENGDLDNFWLVRLQDGREDLQPGSKPGDAEDNFLAH